MAQQLSKKFLRNNSVDGTKIKLLKDQAIRAQKQNGDEVELIKLNLADKILISGSEVSYKSELDAEIASRISTDSVETAARIAGDEAVDLKIEQEKFRAMSAEGEIEDALQAEISRAIEQETILAQDIASETSRASQAELQISLRVDQTVEAIEAEKVRAMAEELRINGRVDSQKTYVDATFIAKSEKGQPNGVVPLNAQSKIESAFLPSYIDDVVEYESISVFPVGEQGKIYVAIDTSKVYRWSGSMFIEISPSEVVSVNGKSGVVTLLAADILTSQSMTIEATLTSLQGYIDEENIRASAEEARIEGKVDFETSRATAEEFRIEGKVDAEVGRASQAEFAEYTRASGEEFRIEGKVDAEITRAMAEELRIEGKVDAEITRAMAEELRIDGKVDAEVLRATAEEFRIEGKVDAEVLRATAEEFRIEGKVDFEVARATAEELTLLKLDGSRPMIGDLDFGGHSARKLSAISNRGPASLVASSVDNLDGKITLHGNFDAYPDMSIVTLESRQGPGNTPPGILPTGLNTSDSYVVHRIYNGSSVVAIQLMPLGVGNRPDLAFPYIEAGVGIIILHFEASLSINVESNVYALGRTIESSKLITQELITQDLTTQEVTTNRISVFDGLYNTPDFQVKVIDLNTHVFFDGNGLTALDFFGPDLSVSNKKITNLAEGVFAQDAVNFNQLQFEKDRAMGVESSLQFELDNLSSYVDETFIAKSQIGQPNGIAPLDENGLVPSQHLPSYIDDVVEHESLLAFPMVGETGKIYVAIDTNKCYRWSGSVYVYITSGAVDSIFGRVGLVTAQAGDYSAEQISYGMGSNVQEKLNSLQTDLDLVEALAAQINGIVYEEMKITISSSDIANGMVALPHLVLPGDFQAFIDRNPLHRGEAEDYTLEVNELGKTALYFKNQLLPVGINALEVGDNLYLRYRRSPMA